MSTLPENEFDLEKLFLPAWAQDAGSANKYSKYEGEVERPDRRGDRRGPRPPRRDGGPGGRRDQQGDRRGGGPGGPGRGPRPDGGRGRPQGDRFGRPEQRERREPPAPLPEVNISLIPDDKGVESLARQIRMTGRAYPLFEIAQMILQKPERHAVVFSVKKDAEGKIVQPIFVCALDDTLWLSEDEAIAHVLRKHFTTFYQAERTPTDPPKGKYTFVAQCGMSGTIFGPPNYHDYQTRVHKLHAERYSRMPLEVYKSRIRIVRDEEVVKKWIEDQSFRTEYICLNLPEPLRLGSMEAVEKHFRETHKEAIIKAVETHRLTGTAAKNLRSPQLVRAARSAWEDQRRFPLQIATVLSQQFASHGLQFFKVNKTVTHVSVARPHYLDLAATPVSDGVRRIVDFINARPRSTRRDVVEALAPTPAPVPGTAAVPAEAQAEGQPLAPAATPAPAPAGTSPTPEQTAVIADLHWLIHQGHVIEFANGILETAKKPLPKPPKPPKAEKAASAAAAPEAEGKAVTPEASGAEAAPAGAAAEPAPAGEPVISAEEAAAASAPADTGAQAQETSAPAPESTEAPAPEEPKAPEGGSPPPVQPGA